MGAIPEGVTVIITDRSTSAKNIEMKKIAEATLSWSNHLMRDGKFVSKQRP